MTTFIKNLTKTVASGIYNAGSSVVNAGAAALNAYAD